jgi:hypothetical protein
VERTTHLEIGEINPMLRIMKFTQEEIPEAPLPCLFFEFFDDRRNDLPSLDRIVGNLGMVQMFSRETLGLQEVDQVLQSFLGELGETGFDLCEGWLEVSQCGVGCRKRE